MNICSKCESKAWWKCKACAILLCTKDKEEHAVENPTHEFDQVLNPIDPELRALALSIVLPRLKLLDKCTSDVIASSESLLEQIDNAKKQGMAKVTHFRDKYIEVCKIINSEVFDEDIPEMEKEIDKVGETYLVYERPANRNPDKLVLWFEEDFLTTVPINEFVQTDKDTMYGNNAAERQTDRPLFSIRAS